MYIKYIAIGEAWLTLTSVIKSIYFRIHQKSAL